MGIRFLLRGLIGLLNDGVDDNHLFLRFRSYKQLQIRLPNYSSKQTILVEATTAVVPSETAIFFVGAPLAAAPVLTVLMVLFFRAAAEVDDEAIPFSLLLLFRLHSNDDDNNSDGDNGNKW